MGCLWSRTPTRRPAACPRDPVRLKGALSVPIKAKQKSETQNPKWFVITICVSKA